MEEGKDERRKICMNLWNNRMENRLKQHIKKKKMEEMTRGIKENLEGQKKETEKQK